MANKAYIITMDKGGLLDTFDYVKFHNQLTAAKGVLTWWHYLESTYIIIVGESSNSATITKFVTTHAPNKHFFVTKIVLKDHGGWLPQAAWDWINEVNKTQTTL